MNLDNQKLNFNSGMEGVKYKRLSTEELNALEKEFINFLSSMQITGADWQKMKIRENIKAEELITVFSDLVYDKVLKKIKFLEYRDAKTLNIFNCLENKISLIGIRVKDQSSLNLTSDDIFSQWTESNLSSINLIKSEKNYTKERELEIFELLQTGCLITDDKLYNLLMEMV